LDVWWYPSDTSRLCLTDMLHRLVTFKKPVAVLDELGMFTMPLPFATNPRVQVYSIEGIKAGERMARFLLGLGHTSAAYFTLSEHTQWSADRLKGIQGQFLRVAKINSVYQYSIELQNALFILFSISSLSKRDVHKIIAIIRPHSEARDMIDQWNLFNKNFEVSLPKRISSDPILRSNLGKLKRVMTGRWNEQFLFHICDAILKAGGLRIYELSLEQLFEKALNEHKTGAWICANDSIAIAAISFLKRKNIRVPADVSVVGFDNAPTDALEHQLTTLDFNALKFVRTMLNFVLRPPKPRGRYQHVPIEIEGIIIERGSAGIHSPAPK
jgi:hypothetical protein